MKATIAGAVLGVITTLVALLALVSFADERWVTRREYNATLQRMDHQLDRIEAKQDRTLEAVK